MNTYKKHRGRGALGVRRRVNITLPLKALRILTPGNIRADSRALRLLQFSLLVLCALVAGCNSYNPNLGVNASQSSLISVIAPSSRAAGCPGFTIEVTGVAFVNGAAVQWNESDRPTTFVSNTQLRVAILASDIASPGTASINVNTPNTSAGNNHSNFVSFTDRKSTRL